MKDTIKKLPDKVANNAHFLYEALASLAGDNEQSKSNENFKFFEEKFEDRNSKSKIVKAQNYVMGVSSAAAEAKYTGLSAVCQQLYQNLSLLPTLEPTQRKSLGAIVENFPRLVSNYLYSPTKVDPCQQLVRILSNVQWAQPCPDSQLSVIRENFKKDAMNQEIDQTIETVDSSHQFVDNVFCTQKALVTNTIQGSSSFSKKKREPQNSKSKSKADLFNKIVEKSDALAVALNQIVSCETQSEAFLGGIEQYTNTIHSLWELAESLGLKGFQEVCTFINDNVFECSSQSQTMRFKQLEPLALWPKLLLDYLQTDDSGAKKLVEFLCQESMPISMSKSNGSRLLTQLLQEGTTRQFSNEPSPDVSSKDDDFATSIFDSQKNDLSTTTNNPKSHVSVNREQELEIVHCELETEPESASHFLTENSAIEKRLKILGGEDLKNSSTKLDEMSEKLPVQKMDLLPTTDSDITSSVQNLSQIPNPSTIELELSVQDSNPSFIELESSVQGGVAVESVNLSEIKTQLLVVPKDLSDEGRDSAQGIELSPEDYKKVSIKKAVETEQAIEESQALDGELLEHDGSEEELPVDSVESIVTEELPTSHREELSADDGNSPDEQFPIPDEGFPQEEPLDIANDVLELLIEQARSATEENAQVLNELIEADEGSETLLAAVMTYTENVQAVADTADMAGLPGLTEVCAFINDNVMALGSQPKSVRFAAREVLSVWTEKVVAYLRHPAIETSVLVSVLTNAHWHQPLDIDAASQLQQRLLEGTTPVPNTAQINMPIEPSVSNDTGRLDVEPDVLELLIGQVRSATEENAQVFNELIEADEGSETLLTAVMTYTENVQAVADIAEMAKLAGLTEVCAFINENVMALGSQPKSVRFAAREVLSVWTEKVVAYLRHPAIETSVLVSVLTNAHWHQPLDIDAASQLQQRLLEGTTPVPNTAQINMPIEPSVSNDSGRLDVEPDVIELLIGQVRSAAEENAQVLNELIEADEGSETLLTAVMTYTENVQAVADAAEMAGLAGLTEVCTFLNENVMALSGTVQSDRLAARDLLETFFDTVVAYLQRPASASKVLVSFVLERQWPTPLDKEAASLLLEHLLERTTSEKNQAAPVEECAKQGAAANESIELAAPDVLELVCSQITDSTEGLSAALEVCVSMENDNPAFLEAIEDYTNKVQEIWETAEMAGLSGLQEICTFVNDNLMAFAGLEQAAKTVAKTYFVGWPLSVLEYLHAPQIGAPSLVSFMQETGWPAPLEAEAANNLLILLTKPSYKESHEAQLSETPTNEYAASEAIAAEEILVHDLTPLEVSIVGDIPLGNAEGLEILIESLESTKEDLATELNKFMTHGPLDAGDAEALENYTELVQRLYTVFEMLGLEGLQTVCRFVIDNIKALSKAELAIRKKAKKVLETWPDLILSYVQSPTPSVLKLVNHLRQPMWTQPLTDEKAQALASQLVAGSTTEEDAEEAAAHNRQIQAQPEDVSLTIPEDINQELLDAYLQEAPQHAGEFSACIQNIIQEAETQEIERAQRIAHTLKGSSNIIGIKGIANIAHHLEDTLEYLAKHQVVPPKDLTDTMVEAADCLEIMVDALLGTDEPPPQALAVLQSVLDWANRIDQGKLDDASPPKSTPVAQTKATQPTSQPATESKAETKGKTATEVAAGTPEQFLRVPTKTIDELMRLVGELSISVGQIQEKLKHVIQSQRTLTEQDLILHKKTFELENLVDVRGITGIETNPKQALEETKDFDPLEFEQYNELHSVAHSFIESIADNRELAISVREDLASLETMFIHQERLNKEFQANIMTTRMVSVTTIVSKLQRNIRQTCRMTGKKAELDVIGTDILIDSDVLSNLADPLQHILRNAVDHGLESVDERAILGKPIEGSIKLSFYREGNNIVVKCEDDGQGLNYTNIRFTAIQRGLITENQELTEKELARLILMSGFSTKSGVTQVSGRGVGMDVVHTNIRQMKGTLDLLSETGKGTRILIKLPMTLVTVHVLLVRVGERRFGIPTNNLEQALAPGMAEFHKVGDEITLKRGKSFYGLKYLANLLSVPGDRKGLEDLETRPIILVHEETGITAVIVDELLDTHDLVMKNMGKYVKKIPGVAGASILGDGSLVPLLDLPELLRSSMQTAMGSIMAEPLSNDDVVVGTGNIPHIMIVDDSLSVRKSLSLLVEDAGFETLLAKDGLEAIEMMNQTRPNVMLVDMEMPRMNGLELTAHVRANQATQNLPIFMITSRTTEKHREQANTAGVNAYLTKPYQETQLLELIDKALAGQV